MTNLNFGNKWDNRFIELAKHISQWSKDESTKVGAIIIDSSKRIVSCGFNGWAKGVKDLPERYKNRTIKYQGIIHAERNALLFANKNAENCVLFCYPFPPCAECASMIIQAGIKRVVAPYPSKELKERWNESLNLSKILFKEANVELKLVDYFNIETTNDFPEFDSTLF